MMISLKLNKTFNYRYKFSDGTPQTFLIQKLLLWSINIQFYTNFRYGGYGMTNYY